MVNRWDSGGSFGSDLIVTNLGAGVTSWTITWQFSRGGAFTDAWGASVSQSGSTVTARSLTYSGAVATNGAATIGFNATGPNGPITAVTFNGIACS